MSLWAGVACVGVWVEMISSDTKRGGRRERGGAVSFDRKGMMGV